MFVAKELIKGIPVIASNGTLIEPPPIPKILLKNPVDSPIKE